MSEELVIGRIRTAFGLHGELKIDLYGGDLAYLKTLHSITVETPSGRVGYRVTSARAAGATYIVGLSGVSTPEQAKQLRNCKIVMPRAAASPLGEDEYYFADLVGLDVLVDGTRQGRVADILEGSGALFLEVLTSSGERRVVPFRTEFVGEIDLGSGTLDLSNGEVLG